jgi:hypothetical protein
MSGPDRDPQHDAAWQQRLAALGAEEPSQRQSEQRAVEALRRAGVLRQRPALGSFARVLLPLAAGMILFLAGGWWGRRSSGEALAANSPRFALFLLEDSTFQGISAVGHDSLVAEYSAWAGGLAQTGSLVLGEELADEEIALGSPTGLSMTRWITGFFIVSAPTSEAALVIARTCPHLRYGGRIVVRPIVPT